MFILDMRTVILLNVSIYIICTMLIVQLWRQNSHRFAGISFWVFNFVLQTVALALIALRGTIPDWISIVLANTLMLAGALLVYMGLEWFVDKISSQFYNYVLVALYTGAFVYATFIDPDLHLRTLIMSAGLLIISFQCLWLLWRRVEPDMRPITFGVGMVFGGYCMVSIVRSIEYFVGSHAGEEFFDSGASQTLMLVSYLILFILLTYGLILMVNKRLYMAVRTQEVKFAKAFHSAPYAITLTRLSDGTMVDVNESFVAITGYDRAEVLGGKTRDLRIWEDEKDRAIIFETLSKTGKVRGLELRFRKKSGEAATGLFSAEIITIDGEKNVLSSIEDITERKRAEQEMAIIAEIGRTVGSTLDINQVFERADTEVRKVIPCDRLLVNLKKTDDYEEFVVVYASGVDNPERRLADSYPSKGTSTRVVMTTRKGILIQPEDPEEIKNLYPNLYATIVNMGLPSAMSVPLISMDEVIGCLTFQSKKPKAYTERDLHLAEKIGMQIAGAIANAQLFKDLSKTEKSLRESEETYRELVEFFPISVFEANSNMRMTSFNHTALETFRYTAEDPVRDIDGHQFFLPGEWERLDKDVIEVMGGASKSSVEYRFIRKDGNTFTGLAYVSPIIRQGVVIGVRGAVIDITDRIKAMEELQKAKDHLLQSEKLVAIGRLAAGVTHEILNPVAIISLELQILMKGSDLSPKTRQRLTVCMEQINRIVAIAEGLKGFSRVKENKLAMGDIAATVDYILTLYRPQLKMKGIQADVQYAANLPMTLMDRDRIEQVILNLIENAIAAMEEKEEKVLRITIDRGTAAGKKDFLRVTIADTGTGISKQDMTKLFEPFFTTKKPDKGTGLGLSISFGIIRDHGGRIWVENNEWGGASFFFEIPIITDEGVTVIKAKEMTHGENSGGR
ncbi:MAG: GAF domain-containing sensor histidine kinase [Syntrophales bacterium]